MNMKSCARTWQHLDHRLGFSTRTCLGLLSIALFLNACEDSSTSSTKSLDQGATWIGEDSSTPWNAELSYGTVKHGGRPYRTIDIGTQRWMAENLSIATANSWVYGNRPENERLHGRLYSWATAMGLPAACDRSVCEDRVRSLQGICPEGWHIPTSDDWWVLSKRLDYTMEGELLRAKTGWINSPGLDFFGFRALPSGRIVESGTISTELGENAYWWSSSEDLSSFAYNQHIDYDEPGLNEGQYRKVYGHSVRCLADAPVTESPAIDSIVLVGDSVHKVIDGSYLAYRNGDSLPARLSTISLRAYSGLALQPMECNGGACSGIPLDGVKTDVAVRIGGGGSASRRYLRILRSAQTWKVTGSHVDG